MLEMEKPPIPIPEDRTDEFDLVVDLALMEHRMFNRDRASARLRVRLDKARKPPKGRAALHKLVLRFVDAMLDEHVAEVTKP